MLLKYINFKQKLINHKKKIEFKVNYENLNIKSNDEIKKSKDIL